MMDPLGLQGTQNDLYGDLSDEQITHPFSTTYLSGRQGHQIRKLVAAGARAAETVARANPITSAVEAGTGKDAITNKKLSNLERGVAVLSVLAAVSGALETEAAAFRGAAAKGFDWDHIITNHAPWGEVAGLIGNRKTIFRAADARELKSIVTTAWSTGKRVGTQWWGGVERISYIGYDARSNQTVEFWYNASTKIVETAYPK